MGLAIALLLGAFTLSAPGDIYRCRDAAGKVSFQDKPCATGVSARLATKGKDATSSLGALQRWLDQQNPHPGASSARVAPATSLPSRSFVGGPVSEAQVAGCSERFLYCAQGNAVAMDACVAGLPRCAADAGGACCPQSCISRYQALRSQGHLLPSAVRLALLDPNAPACSAPVGR